MGGAFITSRTGTKQLKINVGMIGHASSKDTQLLGGSGTCSPKKILKFEILKLLAGNALKMSVLPPPCYFVLYHFKSLTVQSGEVFWLLTGACTPCTPSCL